MDRKEDKKHTRMFAFKKIFEHTVLYLIVLIVLYLILHGFYPKLISFSNSYFKWLLTIIGIYIFIKNYQYYKRLVPMLDRSRFIWELQRESKVKSLKRFMNYYEQKREISKTKLELLRALAPVSIGLFLFSLLLGKFSSITTLKEVANFFTDIKVSNVEEILFSQGVAYLLIFILIYYIFDFINTWKRYKLYSENYYEFKEAFDEITEFKD